MRTTSIGLVAVLVGSSTAIAAPNADALMCKRDGMSTEGKKTAVSFNGADDRRIDNADGTRTIQTGKKGGWEVLDKKTNKAKAVHNKDKSYDCDMAVDDDSKTLNSVRWIGNDTVFAQGWFCEEFDAKPFLANAKTGKFIGYLKFKPVSPETEYRFANLEGTLWAAAVWEHNAQSNSVVVFDAKTAKIKSTKVLKPEDVAKLPDCK